MEAKIPAYSFNDVVGTIVGPGGAFQLAAGSGAAEEGISIEMVEDRNKMDVGADGSVMHSLHAGKAGTCTVRLLKTSPVNAQLMSMYDLQSVASGLWGSNIIVIRQVASGDVTTARQVAFKRAPNQTYAKDGGTMEWSFDCGLVDRILGTY
ncbi:MAG: phage structural protein [Janthinobacterium lividum]